MIEFILFPSLEKATETRDTSVKYSFSFVYLIPVIIVILFAIIVPYMKRRRHRLAMMRRSNMTIPMETHTTQPTAASNPPEVLPPSYPQGGAPYPTSYPASYDQSSLSTNPPPSYVWTTSSNDNPKPLGTLPPPYPPEGPYPPMPLSSPLPAPDAPPPSYDAAVQKWLILSSYYKCKRTCNRIYSRTKFASAHIYSTFGFLYHNILGWVDGLHFYLRYITFLCSYNEIL